MFKSLWIKFLIPLLMISVIGFSAALFLKESMIKDFREYIGGEIEDRIYWIIADLEGSHERYSRWHEDAMVEDAIWALMLGFEIKIRDMNGMVVMDTERAVNILPPLMKRRVMAISDFKRVEGTERFLPYPLFLSGGEIGILEARFIRPGGESIFFIERSNRFLIIYLLALGVLAIFLSLFFSRRLTNPIRELASAVEAIGEGDINRKVGISGSKEISNLSAAFNRMAQALRMQESLRKKLISNL
ncbi:MAG: HAMP domain-containing protein, partial [Nitrospirae bacterium]|nr:HAMP domain-containing protein [Nitrospirota bacterium]